VRWLSLSCLLCACGRIGFGVGPIDADSLDDADARIDDAMVDAAPPTGAFNPPVTTQSLGGGGDDPSLTDDLLMIVFNSTRGGGVGGGDIYQATRTTTTQSFGAVTNQMALNTAGDDATPWLSPDGLAIYYTTAGSVGEKDMFFATRATRTSAWSAPQEITVLSSMGDEAGPALTPDQLAIFFASDRTGNDNIFVATRASITSAWSQPQQIVELSTSMSDGEPWIDASQTAIYFASDRPGGAGGFDLYVARRTTSTVPFDAPERITELSTAADETDPWLAADQRAIYFARANVVMSATR
jgi:Tol biopolymer transport system component